MEEANVIKLLFSVLIIFIAFNIFVNFILLYRSRKKIYKKLSWYWVSVIFTYILISYFQHGYLAIILSYSTSVISISFLVAMGLAPMNFKFPFEKFGIVYFFICVATVFLSYHTESFIMMSTPISVMLAILPAVGIFVIFRNKNKKASVLLKIYAGVLFFMLIHIVNFVFFRMEPNTQLWGWGTTFLINQVCASLLPALVLEETHQTEQERLEELVIVKTENLMKLNANLLESHEGQAKASEKLRTLLRTLIHDLTDPLTVISNGQKMLKESEGTKKEKDLLEAIRSNANKLDKMIENIREEYISTIMERAKESKAREVRKEEIIQQDGDEMDEILKKD